MGIQHAAPWGLTFPGHRRILLESTLARGCQSHPLALPLQPFEASTALHVQTRGCVRDSRARWRSAMPVLFLPSPRIVARGCPSHPLALPLQPFEMRVDGSCVASAGQPHCWHQRQPNGESRTPRRQSSLPRIPTAKLKPSRDSHSVCALLAPAGAQWRTRTRTQSKAPLDRGVGG